MGAGLLAKRPAKALRISQIEYTSSHASTEETRSPVGAGLLAKRPAKAPRISQIQYTSSRAPTEETRSPVGAGLLAKRPAKAPQIPLTQYASSPQHPVPGQAFIRLIPLGQFAQGHSRHVYAIIPPFSCLSPGARALQFSRRLAPACRLKRLDPCGIDDSWPVRRP